MQGRLFCKDEDETIAAVHRPMLVLGQGTGSLDVIAVVVDQEMELERC